MKGLIVTGTDTGIGKTVFAAGLAGARNARYWKPVQAGLDGETDSETVARLAPGVPIHPEAYRLATPASPHLAARIDGVTIAREHLKLPEDASPLVIEGAGGALVPLSETLLSADIFAHWALPVVVVARTALGTINHSLLTIEALRAHGCTVAGIAFVGEAHDENEAIIPLLAGTRRLGRLPHLDPLTPEALARAIATNFNLAGLT